MLKFEGQRLLTVSVRLKIQKSQLQRDKISDLYSQGVSKKHSNRTSRGKSTAKVEVRNFLTVKITKNSTEHKKPPAGMPAGGPKN